MSFPPQGTATKADIIASIATHAALATGIHGVGAGLIVGTTLSQALSNKTLTAPIINGIVTTTGLTLPSFAAGGDINFALKLLTNMKLGGPLTLNGQDFDAGSGQAKILTTGSALGLEIEGSNSAHGLKLLYDWTHTTPDLYSVIGQQEYYSYDHNGTPATQRYALLQVRHANIGDGTEAVEFLWYGMTGGAIDNQIMTLSGAGELGLDLGVNADEYYKVAGTQVVSARGAAVADPTDPASTQARLTDLLGRLRTHGLIAS